MEEIKKLRQEIAHQKIQERKMKMINCYASNNQRMMKSLELSNLDRIRNSSYTSLRPFDQFASKDQLPSVNRLYRGDAMPQVYVSVRE